MFCKFLTVLLDVPAWNLLWNCVKCICMEMDTFRPSDCARMFLFWFFVFARVYAQTSVYRHCERSSSYRTHLDRPLCGLTSADPSCFVLSSAAHLPDACALPRVRLKYSRTELLSVSPAALTSDLTTRLRSLKIGRCLPRKRRSRHHRRKQTLKLQDLCQQSRPIPTTGNIFRRFSTKSNLCNSINHENLIYIPLTSDDSVNTQNCNISLALFNAQSVGSTCKRKRSAINDYILSENVDILCVTETWLKESGDEPKLLDLSPPGYTPFSFPRPTTTCGGGIAFVILDRLSPHCEFNFSFAFNHCTFELVHLKLCPPNSPVINIFSLYRPPGNRKNRFTPRDFVTQFSDLLEFINTIPGKILLIGDFNFPFNRPNEGYTSELLGLLDTFGLEQAVKDSTHKKGNIVDWVVHRTVDNILKSCLVDNNLASDHFAVVCSLDVFKPPVPKCYKEVRKLKAIDLDDFKSDLVSSLPCEPSALQLTSTLRATLDKHAPVSKRLVSNRPTCEWHNTVGPELKEAKQERRRAERRWRRTGLTVDREIFQKARNKVTDIVHEAKSLFYSAKILACSTAKQLFTATNSLLGKISVNPLPTLYKLSELPQKFCDYYW